MPSGNKLVRSFEGHGVQIYQCTKDSWTLLPVPNAMVNHDDAIPELLLKATENHGAGQFGSVTYVQRLATKRGLAPKGRCADGAQASVPYSTSYLFYTAS